MAELKVTLDFATKAARRAAKQASSAMQRSFDGVRKVASRVTGSIGGIIKSFASIQAAAVAAGAAIVGALAGRAAISAANKLEDAMNGMASAMARNGEFTREAFNEMQAFAGQLQSVSRFGADAIMEQLSFSQSLGLTADQATKAATASADLAAALGIGLEQANRNLARTIGGTAGELGEMIPELREMTKEQMMAGDAIDLVAEKFRGAARASINTYAGATDQLGNVFSDLQAAMGSVITRNPAFISGIQNLAKWFGSLQKTIEQNRDEIINYINNAIGRMLTAFQKSLPVIANVITFAAQLGQGMIYTASSISQAAAAFSRFEPAVAVMRFVATQVTRAVFGLIELRVALAKAADALESLVGGPAKNFDRIQEDVDKFRLSIAGFANDIEDFDFDKMADGLDSSAKFGQELAQKLEGVGDFADGASVKIQNMIDGLQESGAIEITPAFNIDGEDVQKQVEDAVSGSKRNISDMLKGAIKAEEILVDAGAKREEENALQAEIIPTIGKSLVESLVQGGKEGAQGFVENAAAAAGQAFLGPMGQSAGAIVGLLSQGPEAVRETIQSFVDALPEVLNTVIESIPVLIEAFIEALPELFDALIDAIPLLIDALVNGIPKFIEGLIAAIPKIITSFIEAIPQIIKSFINYFISGIPQIIMALARGVADAIGAFLSNISGGFLGFNSGGMVPAGFPNDSMPARLTSGEYVIDRSLTKQLQGFLSGGSQQQSGQSDAMLSLILDELRQPQQIESDFELQDRGFARAQLRMSKLNRRTT